MNTNLYSIGNIVLLNGKPCHIIGFKPSNNTNLVLTTASTKWVSIDDIEPMPLTPEILKATGWDGDDYTPDSFFYTGTIAGRVEITAKICFIESGYVGKRIRKAEFYWSPGGVWIAQLKYVHELQAALLLAGDEYTTPDINIKSII